MLPTDKFFVPREEILKLTSNSFEHRATQIEEVVRQAKDRFFGGAEPQILGTFDSHAVVLTDDGKVFQVQYEDTAQGAPHLLGVSPVSAAVYSRETLPTYLRKEAKQAADLFLKGFAAESLKRIAQLAKQMDENSVYTDDQIVDPLVATVLQSKLWKKQIGEKTESELKQLLGESFDQIDTQKLRSKFSKLYDGSVSDSEQEKYRGLVNEDVSHLHERLNAVLDQALQSIGTLRGIAEKVADDQRETLTAFVSFVEDLAEDTRQVKKSFLSALQGVESVGTLGRLYDTLAEELLRYEIAGGFAVQMTTRLAAASR